MCGPHRKRKATEDEDDVAAANVSADSPYATFLSSLRPKTKGAALLQDNAVMGEPAVVYTGAYRKPGTVVVNADPKPKAKSKKTNQTAAAKPAPKDGAAAAAATTTSDAPKPKPKSTGQKPAPKTSQAPPTQITPTLTSQTR